MELTVTKIDFASRGLLKQLAARETVAHDRTVTMPEVLKWLILAGSEKPEVLGLGFKSMSKAKSKSKSKAKRRVKSNKYTTEFAVIWEPYPNGDAKREAFEEWLLVAGKKGRHAGLDAPSLALILQTIDWKLETPTWAKGYVEQLQKFLRRRRWEDTPSAGIYRKPIEQFEAEIKGRLEEGS